MHNATLADVLVLNVVISADGLDKQFLIKTVTPPEDSDILIFVSKDKILPFILTLCLSRVLFSKILPWWFKEIFSLNFSPLITFVAPLLYWDAFAKIATLYFGLKNRYIFVLILLTLNYLTNLIDKSLYQLIQMKNLNSYIVQYDHSIHNIYLK